MISLSVCSTCFNQDKFIAEMVRGVLSQKTHFSYRLIVSDDCSTDKTARILQTLASKYPSKIKLNLRKKNIGSMANWIETLNRIKGKYVAICEGDDYWTDPNKLQKQVDFLEGHPDFSITSHNVLVKNEATGKFSDQKYKYLQKNTYTLEDVIKEGSRGATCSLVFRRDAVLPYPKWFSKLHSADWPTQILACLSGKLFYFKEIMGVYRQNHSGSALITAVRQAEASGKETIGIAHRNIAETVQVLDRGLSYKYHDWFQKPLFSSYQNLAKAYFQNRRYLDSARYGLEMLKNIAV
jgi:glycosyltransferase involved in cell wall biosynthesis